MIDNEKIARLMKEKGIQRQEMADEIGVSGAMMTYIIQGKRKPDVESLVRIAQKLGCAVDELIKKP